MAGKRSGVALASVLLMSVILMVMVMALFKSVGGQLFISKNQFDEIVALNSAEAGVARTMQLLELSPTFNADLIDQSMPSLRGTYTIMFWDGSGVPGPDDSVNNLFGLTPAPSSRGPIPPNSALIICTGKLGSATRRVEALVRGGPSSVEFPVLGAGELRFRGRMKVDGIESLSSSNPLDVEIHSSKTGVGNMVSWDPILATDRAIVQGKVSSSSNTPDRILFDGSNAPGSYPNYDVMDFQRSAPKPAPFIDIESAVAGHSSSPGAVLPSAGTVVLNGGNHYYDTDQSIDGDLVLKNGAKIYVKGNFTVNGSITGKGAVMVTGDTALMGDATLDGSSSDYVSLLSKGNVVLRGFDGTRALDTIAALDPADPTTPQGQETQEMWQGVQDAMKEVQTVMALPRDQWVGDGVPEQTRFDQARGLLGNDDHWSLPGYGNTVVQDLRARLPAGRTGDFLRERLDSLKIYRRVGEDASRNDIGWDATSINNILTAWRNGTYDDSMGGVVDAAQTMDWTTLSSSPNDLAVLDQVVQVTNQLDYDRLGTAFFKGLIYSNGSIYAANEVNIVGAAMTSALDAPPSTVDGITLNPGDIYLNNNTRITYVKDMFDNGTPNLAGAGVISMVSWISR